MAYCRDLALPTRRLAGLWFYQQAVAGCCQIIAVHARRQISKPGCRHLYLCIAVQARHRKHFVQEVGRIPAGQAVDALHHLHVLTCQGFNCGSTQGRGAFVYMQLASIKGRGQQVVVQLIIVFDIALLFAFFNLVKRRLRYEDVSVFD